MEPSLGSLNHPGPTAQTHWGGGDATIDHDEVEDENEHAGDVLDESHDAREDDEYSLGWTEHTDQHKAGIVDAKTWNDPDGEPDLGWTGCGQGWQEGGGMDDREGDDEREEPSHWSKQARLLWWPSPFLDGTNDRKRRSDSNPRSRACSSWPISRSGMRRGVARTGHTRRTRLFGDRRPEILLGARRWSETRRM